MSRLKVSGRDEGDGPSAADGGLSQPPTAITLTRTHQARSVCALKRRLALPSSATGDIVRASTGRQLFGYSANVNGRRVSVSHAGGVTFRFGIWNFGEVVAPMTSPSSAEAASL